MNIVFMSYCICLCKMQTLQITKGVICKVNRFKAHETMYKLRQCDIGGLLYPQFTEERLYYAL